MNCSSVERSKLFQEYLNYCRDLKELCYNAQLTQWVDGSFASISNLRPRDIDIVTFIDSAIFQDLRDKLRPFSYPHSKIKYVGIDAYIVESLFQETAVFQHDKAYWRSQFDSTRRNSRTGIKRPKGFLEIIF